MLVMAGLTLWAVLGSNLEEKLSNLMMTQHDTQIHRQKLILV